MKDNDQDIRTERIFCRNRDGNCVGLSPNTVVIEKKKKYVIIGGKKVLGWDIKVVQDDFEGHFDVDYKRHSIE